MYDHNIDCSIDRKSKFLPQLGFIAQSCLAPGFTTLMANLFAMRFYQYLTFSLFISEFCSEFIQYIANWLKCEPQIWQEKQKHILIINIAGQEKQARTWRRGREIIWRAPGWLKNNQIRLNAKFIRCGTGARCTPRFSRPPLSGWLSTKPLSCASPRLISLNLHRFFLFIRWKLS